MSLSGMVRVMGCSFFSALFLLGSTPLGLAWAEDVGEAHRPDPLVTLGVLGTKDYTEGIGDVVVPLYATGANLWFMNLRASATDRDAQEYNLGTGFRRLIRQGQGIAGGNIFFDHRETRAGASFDQVGAGLEYLSHRFDARANAYLPLQDKKKVNEFTVNEETTSLSKGSGLETKWDEPYAQGHDVRQSYEQNFVVYNRATTLSTDYLFREYEVALRGWDAEMGMLLPLDPLADWVRFKAFGGYYHYLGRYGVSDVRGFRARLEARLRPAFSLEAVYYSDDALTGGHFNLGAYVSLPFDMTELANGRNPFSGTDRRWQSGRHGGDLSHRLVDMVKRDPQVRTSVTEPEEVVDRRVESVTTRLSVARQKVDAGDVIVASDITFVDADHPNADDANAGTFEAPKASIQAGVQDPRSMVFVFDTAGVYEEAVVITASGVNLRGSGCPLVANGGQTFGSGVRPVIDGSGATPTLMVATDAASIRGFEIMNTLGGIPAGRGIEALIPNGGLTLDIACNLIHQTEKAVFVDVTGDLSVTLANNMIRDNFSGVQITGTGNSGIYFVNVRDNTFLNNAVIGLDLGASNYDMAAAIVHGNRVEGSTIGINVAMDNPWTSLLSLSDIQAHNNVIGIHADVRSGGGAVVLAGLPKTLLGLADDVVGGMGMPAEVEAFLRTGGPINVDNNVGQGMVLNVNGENLALLALFDVQASGMLGAGVSADVYSNDGLAIGLAGSSQNLMEVLQLGANLIDVLTSGLDLPVIPDSPIKPASFENNGTQGLEMNVEGRYGALAAVLGVQAHNNENGLNVNAISSDGFALGALARIEASGNNNRGIGLNVVGDSFALGAAYDFTASGNHEGLAMNVEGDMAVGLMGSTDPLRSLADIANTALSLYPPIQIPGAPHGPSTAVGNTGDGISVSIAGERLALGVVMDVQALGNAGVGLQAHIESTDGEAIGVIGSSDMLFEILPPILGEGLLGDPDALGAVAYIPMGDMLLTGNGHGGLQVDVNGRSGSVLLAGGITAHGEGGMGHGLTVNLESVSGSVFAGLAGITAQDQDGKGLTVNAVARDQVTLALMDVLTTDNSGRGIDVVATSDTDDVFLILAGVDSHDNGLQGIRAQLYAAQDIGVAVTAANALGNGRHGMLLNAEAGHEAFVWFGDLAIEDLRHEFGDYDLLGASEALYAFMPTGPVAFNANGYDDANPDPRPGLRVNVSAVNDITFVATGGNEFSGNKGNGLHLDLESLAGDVDVRLEYAEMIGNDLSGVIINAETSDGSINVFLGNIRANQNALDGIRALLRNSASNPGEEINVIIANSTAMDNDRWDYFGRFYYGTGGAVNEAYSLFIRDTENKLVILE